MNEIDDKLFFLPSAVRSQSGNSPRQPDDPRSILLGFFRLSHNLEKAVEAIEETIGKLSEADALIGRIVMEAWGDDSAVKRSIQRLDATCLRLYEQLAPGSGKERG